MKQLLTALFFIAFLGCHQNNASFEDMDSKVTGELERMEESNSGQNPVADLNRSDGQVIKTQNQPAGKKDDDQAEKNKNPKKMIKTAHMQMEVKNYKEARTQIDNAVTAKGGAITRENENRSSYRLENTLTIRVKPEELENLLAELEKIAFVLDSKSVEAQDVTEQFIDIESRLRTKREVEARYRDILRQAKSIPDILAVEERLRVLVEEIESLEGRLKYLSDQVGFSTINLRFYETFERVISRKKSFFNRIGKSITQGWTGLQEFLIGLVSIWPFVLITIGLIWWGRRIWKRRKAKT